MEFRFLTKVDFSKLEKNLGIRFKNQDLLKQALTHRSYLNENPDWPYGQNERLEFLGDAALELATTEHLYLNYENPEGELTSFRAALVNSVSLSEAANEIGLNDFLLLSRGEAKEFGRSREVILANAFEALVGAIYLDRGYGAVQKFLGKVLFPKIEKIIKLGLWRDPKSRFQEEAQSRSGLTPSYKVLREWGPDHAKHFRVGLYLGDEKVAEGEGVSKQTAEVAAAEEGLRVKGW